MGMKMSGMKIGGFDDYLSSVVKLLSIRLPRSGVLSDIAFANPANAEIIIISFIFFSAAVHPQQITQS